VWREGGPGELGLPGRGGPGGPGHALPAEGHPPLLYACHQTSTIQVVRYLDVAEALRGRLAAGEHGPGGALESEAELGKLLGASRVTVRKALELLRSEGLVSSRRGSGWFVALDPVRQPLGRVTTVEAALEEAGARPARRVLEFGFGAATAEVAAALLLSAGDDVLRVRRLSLADGEPFAIVTVWVPGELGAPLSRSDVERATFYDLLPLRGIVLGRATQTIGAGLATVEDARLLGVASGDPLLVCERVTRTAEDVPVLVSEHRYPAARTHFEIEFPSVALGDHTSPKAARPSASRRTSPSEALTAAARGAAGSAGDHPPSSIPEWSKP